jgi:hypothetical protein
VTVLCPGIMCTKDNHNKRRRVEIFSWGMKSQCHHIKK